MMDLITAAAILVSQAMEAQAASSYILSQANMIQQLATQENSTPAINPQVKAIVASADANMEGLRAQTVLLQTALDQIANIVN